MTEAPAAALRIEPAPADALFVAQIWGDAAAGEAALGAVVGPPPRPGRASSAGARRTLWWEPRTWLVHAPVAEREDLAAALADALGGSGASTDISGGFRRFRLRGPRWRELLMIGGVFDAESPAFGPGCVAATLIHHLPVRLDVVAPDTIDAYTPPSHAGELLHHWRQAQARFAAEL